MIELMRTFDELAMAQVGVLRRTRTGHTWQFRYVRGTYSRAFGKDKRVSIRSEVPS